MLNAHFGALMYHDDWIVFNCDSCARYQPKAEDKGCEIAAAVAEAYSFGKTVSYEIAIRARPAHEKIRHFRSHCGEWLFRKTV